MSDDEITVEDLEVAFFALEEWLEVHEDFEGDGGTEEDLIRVRRVASHIDRLIRRVKASQGVLKLVKPPDVH